MKETTSTELDALIGLLYLAGLNKSSLKDLWRTDGTGVDIFRTTMSLQRFSFCKTVFALMINQQERHVKSLKTWLLSEHSLKSLLTAARKLTPLTNI